MNNHSIRTKRGLKRAKKAGIKLGRPAIPDSHVTYIRHLSWKGFSMREISEITDYSVGAISKYTWVS